MTRETVELQRSVMLNMDAPHHTRLRKIISRGFTPRAIGRLQEELAQRAQNIAKTAAAAGSGDFLEQVSCELPLQAIAALLGVAHERVKNPNDDIVTTLIQADVTAEKLSDDEFGFWVIMLAVAINETTRNP